MGIPILLIAVVPAKVNKSPQLNPAPYFSLIGTSSARALSKLVLSSQLNPAPYFS